MTSPGWYPDPQDPQWQQFYDGQRWTGDRRPAGDPYGGQQQVPQPVYYPEQPYPEQPYPQQPYAEQPYGQPQQPVFGPEQAGYPQPGGWGTPPPARARRKVPLIIGVVVVLVAGLLTGGYFLFLRGDSAKFTYNGKAIADPEQPLKQAETAVAAMVKSRHGVQGKDMHCYYAVPKDPPKGTKKTDVDQAIWCGPVLFVDGTVGSEYLRFTVTSADAKGGKVTLTPAEQPVDKSPAARPGGSSLKRPDGSTPPSGNGGITPPAPPAADADVMTSVSDLGTQTVPAAPAGAVIGSINGGIRLTKLGPVTRYGAGDDARTAPAGQKLIAFALGAGYNADGDTASLVKAAALSVDGGAARPLPDATGDYYVVAVPTGAKTVDLVLADAGYTQTLSLLTGKPGSGNLAVLARQHRVVSVNKSMQMTLNLSPEVVFPDGVSGSSETISVTVEDAYLWWTPARHPAAKPSKPGNALLYINVGFHDPHQPSVDPFGFRPEVLKFTPTGGAAIPARNVSTDAGRLYDVFEVPAGLTTGTLTISGSYTDTFNDSTDTYTTTIATPVNVPISFPAG